jgi:hypothetical protein
MKEQYYIDNLNPSYNILKIAKSSLGYKHSESAIEKMSLAKKAKYLGPNNPFYGKNHSDETKELFKNYALAREKSPNAMSVILKDSNNAVIGEFKSMTELSKFLKADKAQLAKHRNEGTLFRDKYYIIPFHYKKD